MDINELLLTVQKPGRYIGGEWNSVKKDWTGEKVKVLLAFPDVYEVGSSHLGIKILYGILNGRDDCLCERVFSPWPDFENALRKSGTGIFSLESRKGMNEFDIIGFSLAYELGYTNVLNLLDLGRIPIKSSERGDAHPLVIAGGPCCCNPEPMAEFIDLFVIGDGEEAIKELVEAFRASRNIRSSRRELLKELAKIKGVYVPAFHAVEYNDDRTIKSFLPSESGIPAKIEKRVVSNLDDAFYPVKQIVPNIQVVHDRIVLEIMRGCKHACKFCQACAVYSPCRERSVERIVELALQSYAETGYDEISLLSLSSGDHSGIKDIIERLNKAFTSRAVSISVPSLRIEDILKDLPALISKVKKSGLTFAPEAGSERLRTAINKNIDITNLFEAAAESFKSGWRRLKLYFMIGLPGEDEADVTDIAGLIHEIIKLKSKISAGPVNITGSVNAFIPKPDSSFERAAMDGMDILEKKRAVLRNAVKHKTVELDFHSFKMSFIEAVIARGDRSLSGVILESWKSGARFDGWQDHFNFDIWLKSFKTIGIDPSFYANRQRDPKEILPWDFITIR